MSNYWVEIQKYCWLSVEGNKVAIIHDGYEKADIYELYINSGTPIRFDDFEVAKQIAQDYMEAVESWAKWKVRTDTFTEI